MRYVAFDRAHRQSADIAELSGLRCRHAEQQQSLGATRLCLVQNEIISFVPAPTSRENHLGGVKAVKSNQVFPRCFTTIGSAIMAPLIMTGHDRRCSVHSAGRAPSMPITSPIS